MVLSMLCESGIPTHVRHLVLEESLQWVIRRIFTGHIDTAHIECNALLLPCHEYQLDRITLIYHVLHTYFPIGEFATSSIQFSSISNALYYNIRNPTNWPSLKPLINKVHKHLCLIYSQYCPGTFKTIDENIYHTDYNYGDTKALYIAKYTCRYSSDYFQEFSALTNELSTVELIVLASIFECLVNKSFRSFNSQGFPSFRLVNSYSEGETAFMRTRDRERIIPF